MSIFFDEDKATTPESTTSFSKGTRTDFMQNFSSAYDAFTRSELFTSERNNLSEEYGNIVNIAQKAGHSDIINPLDQQFNPFTMENIDPNDPSFAKTKDQLQADFWNKVNERQTTDENFKNLLSEAGLDNSDNMLNTISKKAHSAWKEYSEINERSTTGGTIGGFAGIAGGAFTDPIIQLATVASFGYAVPETLGAAALRVAYMEAIIGGVSETLIQLKAQPYRKELGFEDAGLATGAKNVAMVTGASAVLSPALLGVFKAFGKSIDAGKKLLSKTPAEDLQKIHKEIGEKINSKYKDKALNDYEIPKQDIPDNIPAARTEHNERLNTAVKQFQDGEPVDLPPIKNKIIYHGTDKYFKDFDLNKTADQSIWFTDDLNAINAGTVGASGKGNIISRIIDENRIKLATAEQAEKLTDDQLIAQGFDGVKLEKSAGYTENNYRIFNTEQLNKTLDDQIIEAKATVAKIKKVLENKGQNDEGTALLGQATRKYRELLAQKDKLNTAPEKISEVDSKNGFNKNETKLAEDIEGVKNFDVPNEAALRSQASDLELSMFDVSTSSAIKIEAGTGSAAKTAPTPISEGSQTLSAASQKTDATPSSVLATATTTPPLIRGSTIKRVGDKSDIGKSLYHISNDFNEIYSTLSGKIDDVVNDLTPIAEKYNANLTARIKEKSKINEKLNKKIQPQSISDYLGARLSTNTILDAKLILNDIAKTHKIIHSDDFLDDLGRTTSHKTEYKAIHAQALTKDGYTFEIQIRLKELDPLTEKSHAIYKQIKWSSKELTDSEFSKLLVAEQKINKELKAKYFQIKDKEFARMNSTDPLDMPIPVGQRLDDATGEKIPLTKTARELFEQDGKNKTMLERLKDCV